jgi:lysophospholipase L1-like esterase
MTTRFSRFVALGDSQTEGLNDGDKTTGVRGWADRLAEKLAEVNPDLLYANLAISGCRARHVRTTQLDAALALEPDLATVVVGMNDLLRHDYDLEQTARDIEETIVALQAAGAHVVTMTFPDIDQMLPVMRWLAPRQRALNVRVREVAARHEVPLLELSGLAMVADPRMWSHDRIHGSTEGHTRIAAGAAYVMGLPGADPSWSDVPPPNRGPVWKAAARDARWVATFMAPWLTRQLLGRNAQEARTPKRPTLLPVRADVTVNRPTGT